MAPSGSSWPRSTGRSLAAQATDGGAACRRLWQAAARDSRPGPGRALVDGRFTELADIETVSASGETTVYVPVAKPRDPQRDPHARSSAIPPKLGHGVAGGPPPQDQGDPQACLDAGRGNAQPPPNVSTPWRAIAVSNTFWCADCSRLRRFCSGSPSLTTCLASSACAPLKPESELRRLTK